LQTTANSEKKQLIKEKQKPAKLIVPGKTSKAFKI
jgi:hypothetical protein